MALKTDFRAHKRVQKSLATAAARYPSAIAQGMVSARRKSATIVRRAVQDDRNLKAGRIKQDISDAAAGDNGFTITGSNEPISLKSYGARRTATGLSVQVLRTSGRRVIPGAFLVRGSDDLPPFIRQGEKRKATKGRYAQAKYLRQPLKALYGPSVADAMASPGLRRFAGASIKNAIDGEVERAIKRTAGKRFAS